MRMNSAHKTAHCLLSLLIAAATMSGSALADEKRDVEQRARHIEERFKTADANHDGKLTREEASAMPRIAKNFDKIDKEKKGYVTVEQVKSFARGTP